MKKLALAAVIAVAFVACQKKEEAAPVVDTTAVAPVAADSAVADSAKAVVDSAKPAVDSAKK